jgi:hypothetical protein
MKIILGIICIAVAFAMHKNQNKTKEGFLDILEAILFFGGIALVIFGIIS